jgi:hypothetical protein
MIGGMPEVPSSNPEDASINRTGKRNAIRMMCWLGGHWDFSPTVRRNGNVRDQIGK